MRVLVVIGVREDRQQELLAVEDGYRDFEDSWSAAFRDLKARGMNEPKLCCRDGAPGAGAALGNVSPDRSLRHHQDSGAVWVTRSSPPAPSLSG